MPRKKTPEQKEAQTKTRMHRRKLAAVSALQQAVAGASNHSAFRATATSILENFFIKFKTPNESGQARFAGVLADEIENGQGLSRVKAFDIVTRLLVVAGTGNHDKTDLSMISDQDLEKEVQAMFGEVTSAKRERAKGSRPDESELAEPDDGESDGGVAGEAAPAEDPS